MAMLKIKLTDEQKIMFKEFLPNMVTEVEIPDDKFTRLYNLLLKDYQEQENG